MHKKFLIILFTASSLSCMEKEPKYMSAMVEPNKQEQVTLITSDEQMLKIDRSKAEKSVIINNVLQECAHEPIALENQACTKSALENVFLLVDQPNQEITEKLLTKTASNLAQECAVVNYLNISTLLTAYISFLTAMVIQEKDSEHLKQCIKILKSLPFDLQKLIKQKLIHKTLLCLYDNFKSSCTRLELKKTEPGAIFCGAISPDDNKALTGSADNKVYIWDLGTGKPIKILEGHSKGIITSVSFNADATQALTTSYDDTARVWDLETGECIKTYQYHELLSASFTNSGIRCVIRSNDGISLLYVNTNTVKIVAAQQIYAWDFDLDGNYALTGSGDQIARLWNLTTGECLKKLKDHLGVLAFVPNSKVVLSGTNDYSVRLWDLQTGKIKLLKGHSGGIVTAAFTSDGTCLLTGSQDKTAILWNMETGESIRTFKFDDMVNSVAFSGNGTAILIGEYQQAHYIRLVPQELLNASLEQLIIMMKLQDMPHILQDDYFANVLNALDSKLQQCLNLAKSAFKK